MLNSKRMNRILTRTTSTIASAAKNKRTDFEHCVSFVKETDFNFYLSTLIMPKPIIRSAFAVRAFNIELLSIGRPHTQQQQKATISQMKLQFWQDQLKKIYDESATTRSKEERIKLFEPVSNELAFVVNEYNVARTWFNRLIDGRRQFFAVQQFKTLDELEKCADASMSTVYYILLQCINKNSKASMDCDHAASHLGKAEMLTGVARNMLKQSSQVVYYLPADLLAKHQVAQQDLINFSSRVLKSKQKNLKDLTFEICTRADQHLKSARSLSGKLPAEVRTIYASAMHLEVILKQMEKYDFDLMDKRLASDFRLNIIYKTILAKLKNTY